jgi:hypothetical protein
VERGPCPMVVIPEGNPRLPLPYGCHSRRESAFALVVVGSLHRLLIRSGCVPAPAPQVGTYFSTENTSATSTRIAVPSTTNSVLLLNPSAPYTNASRFAGSNAQTLFGPIAT